MRNYIIYSLVLFLVVGISCGVLAYVHQLTKPLIEENLRLEEELARKVVFPNATRFEFVENDLKNYFQVYDAEEQLIGYTIVAVGRGYSSNIQTMVGLNIDLSINNISVIYQNETPGLGDKYVNKDFYKLFIGLKQANMRVDKDGGQIDSITGATVTARAIVKAVEEGIGKLNQLLSKSE